MPQKLHWYTSEVLRITKRIGWAGSAWIQQNGAWIKRFLPRSHSSLLFSRSRCLGLQGGCQSPQVCPFQARSSFSSRQSIFKLVELTCFCLPSSSSDTQRSPEDLGWEGYSNGGNSILATKGLVSAPVRAIEEKILEVAKNEGLMLCYDIEELLLLKELRAHCTRSVSVSWAEKNLVFLDQICWAATWSSSCFFTKHYGLDTSRWRDGLWQKKKQLFFIFRIPPPCFYCCAYPIVCLRTIGKVKIYSLKIFFPWVRRQHSHLLLLKCIY